MTPNTRIPTLSPLQDAPSGVLTRGRWDIIMPEETTNLIVNPSVEVDTSGYGTLGGLTIQRNASESAFGVACLEVSTNSSSAAMAVNMNAFAVTAGQQYTFSFYYKKTAPQDMKGRVVIEYYFNDTFTSTIYLLSTITIDLPAGSIAQWTRFVLTTTAPASANMMTIAPVSLVGQPTGRAFNMKIDGVQLEAKPYATTYVDGTQDGCMWLGSAHNSQSFRRYTKKGGRIMNLSSFKFQIAAVVGLGAATVQPIHTPYAQIGGGLYQRTIAPARTFQIAGGWDCDSDIDLHRNRQALVNALTSAGADDGELTRLIYTPAASNCNADTINTPASQSVVIDAAYSGGLEGAWTNDVGIERATMVFTSYLPFMAIGSSPFDSSVIAASTAATNNSPNVQWRNIFTGVFAPSSNTINGLVRAIAVSPSGQIVIGGDFTSPGNRIAMWTGTSWQALGTGMNGSVWALAFAPDGTLYAGGTFTAAGGVATGSIAKWNGGSWSTAGGSALPAGANIFSLAFDPQGVLWIGGRYDIGGGMYFPTLTTWDGSTFADIGANVPYVNSLPRAGNAFTNGVLPANGAHASAGIYSLAVAPDGVYLGGLFTLNNWGSVNGYVNLARYSLTTRGEATLDAATPTYISNAVEALAALPDGSIVAGGNFSLPSPYLLKLPAFGMSMQSFAIAPNARVRGLYARQDGSFLMAGDFTSIGGLSLAGFAEYRNGWAHPDIQASGGGVGYAVTEQYGLQAWGGSWSSVTVATTLDITVTSSMPVSPEIVVPAMGAFRNVRNWTTGDAILTNTPALQNAAILKTGANASYQTVAGSLLSAVLSGSSLATFRLRPGVNRLSIFGTPTTAALLIRWKNQYASLDAVH